MEQRFGHDFSQVRVHTDETAARSAKGLDARAYTTGKHVVFGGGKYVPESAAGRGLLAHELTHVVQQEHAGADAGAGVVQRQPESQTEPQSEPEEAQARRQGEEVTSIEEQRRRFIEAFNQNPQAALADIANLLEIGGGQFEVYGLIYVDNETGELEIIRQLAPEHRAVLAEVQRLLSRTVTNVSQDMPETRSLLQRLESLTDLDAALKRITIRPGRALEVLDRVQSQLDAGRQGYPDVSDGDLGNVQSAIESFSNGMAMHIPRSARPRPEGRTLLGYFHTHPQTIPPSGIRGFPSSGGDIGVASDLGEGSFMITGPPDRPLIYFIAEGKYWDLTNNLQEALDRQISLVAGFDRALGGAFGELTFGAEGFGIRARASESRSGVRVSQGFNIGDYRLNLSGELNPAVASADPSLIGRPETRRLTEASTLAGGLEFNFSNQPFVPGSISIQALSAGAVRIEGRFDPIPVPADVELVGGATLFEGEAGLEAEGYFGIESRAGLPIPLLPGGLGYGLRVIPGRDFVISASYENPWMRVDVSRSSATGEFSLSTGINYRLPTGTLRLNLGYEGQVFGSIGYQLHLP